MTGIYSAASLGKQALSQLNIKPFMQQTPDFPPKILGKLMSAYHGGRCECRIRKTPIKVTVLDIFSTYPTVTLLFGLWEVVIADKIQYVDDTENIQRLIDEFTFEDALNRDFWKLLNVLVEIESDGDILPVRAKYADEDGTFNIGVNRIKSNDPLYYFLPDILASKLLTGKSPKIKRAIRFIHKGIQEGWLRLTVRYVESPYKASRICLE